MNVIEGYALVFPKGALGYQHLSHDFPVFHGAQSINEDKIRMQRSRDPVVKPTGTWTEVNID